MTPPARDWRAERLRRAAPGWKPARLSERHRMANDRAMLEAMLERAVDVARRAGARLFDVPDTPLRETPLELCSTCDGRRRIADELELDVLTCPTCAGDGVVASRLG